jgi:hypothetical protein
VEHVQSVTLDQANASIQARIQPNDLLVCVVGTDKEIGGALKDAIPGLCSVEVVPFDADE